MKASPKKWIDKAKGIMDTCIPQEADLVILHMPGCFPNRMIPVKGPHPVWSWNQDTERPTLKPSIRTRAGDQVCHSFVTDGKVKFLNDCTHEFAGQTVDLLEVEWDE